MLLRRTCSQQPMSQHHVALGRWCRLGSRCTHPSSKQHSDTGSIRTPHRCVWLCHTWIKVNPDKTSHLPSMRRERERERERKRRMHARTHTHTKRTCAHTTELRALRLISESCCSKTPGFSLPWHPVLLATSACRSWACCPVVLGRQTTACGPRLVGNGINQSERQSKHSERVLERGLSQKTCSYPYYKLIFNNLPKYLINYYYY